MRRIFSQETGVISILFVLILPIIAMGVIAVYSLLSIEQQENKMQKITYATSEAYLSKYNAFLFEQLGVLCTFDSVGIEPMTRYYLIQNKIITNPEEISFDVKYEKMDDVNVFKEAVIEAASVMISKEIVDYTSDIFGQLKGFEKIKQINEMFESYENKLSDQFDRAGVTEILTKISSTRNVTAGVNGVDALKKLLSSQDAEFNNTIVMFETKIENLKDLINNSENTMDDFLKFKMNGIEESKNEFTHQENVLITEANQLLEIYSNIEVAETVLTQLLEDIENLKTKRIDYEQFPQDAQDELIQLLAQKEDLIESIDSKYASVENIVEMMTTKEVRDTSLIDVLKDIIYNFESAISGVVVDDNDLLLDAKYKHSDQDLMDTEQSTDKKVLLNEYFLSIFNSYDLNCPRKTGQNNRLEINRTIKGEVEYLLSGLEEEKYSVSNVRIKIFAIRSAANLLTIMTDNSKLSQITNAVIALPPPWKAIAYSAALVAWSGSESYMDINRLMKGEGFYLLKSQEQWALDFETLITGSWKKTEKIDSEKNEPSPSKFDPKLFYQDYLRILLLMQNENATTLRAMDLIDLEILKITENKQSLKQFSRGHTITLTWFPVDRLGLLKLNKSNMSFRNGYR